jgi:hypothetical protein
MFLAPSSPWSKGGERQISGIEEAVVAVADDDHVVVLGHSREPRYKKANFRYCRTDILLFLAAGTSPAEFQEWVCLR